MTPEQVESVVRENVDKTVCVTYIDGQKQMLFVHSVDDEGFVCDIAAEMTEPPACAYWVRFRHVLEVHPNSE